MSGAKYRRAAAVMPKPSALMKSGGNRFSWLATSESGAPQEKLLPPDFISAVGFGITATARRYLAPLIVGEAYPPFKNGLPDYVKLQNVAVPKKLNTDFAI